MWVLGDHRLDDCARVANIFRFASGISTRLRHRWSPTQLRNCAMQQLPRRADSVPDFGGLTVRLAYKSVELRLCQLPLCDRRTQMRHAQLFRSLCAAPFFIITIIIAVGGGFLFSSMAVAKSNMTVKMSPEYTRQNKGSGKVDTTKAPRDAASGQATGKRMYKPTRINAQSQSVKPKLTPEKVEAGSENVKR